jgi:hypothetical protein
MRPESRSPIDREAPPIRPGARRICSLFLLIVTVIQGITPDLADLASMRAFDLLFQVMNPGQCGREGTWAGDESSPAILRACPGIPGWARGIRQPGILPITSIKGVVASTVSCRLRTPPVLGSPSINLLCHLIC